MCVLGLPLLARSATHLPCASEPSQQLPRTHFAQSTHIKWISLPSSGRSVLLTSQTDTEHSDLVLFILDCYYFCLLSLGGRNGDATFCMLLHAFSAARGRPDQDAKAKVLTGSDTEASTLHRAVQYLTVSLWTSGILVVMNSLWE